MTGNRNLTKSELMKQLLNLYEQNQEFPNPVVDEYIAKLESMLGIALVVNHRSYILTNLNGED